ncbi:MAG: hypothetical protein ISR55_05090 [Bacteroidetes bacterium]|nr:hypothetical protein [Bacteroidota bacterium]
MIVNKKESRLLHDGSKLIVESLVQSGADIFIGYPITPANLLYLYSHKRFPTFIAAPDEITTLQWMCGFATTGKIPVTATSFPGFALMLESVNMALMMELPMVVVLVQRLGPATGTATCGSQGDLALLNGGISGGFSLPTISISKMEDCWTMSNKALKMAVELRSPVILLTSKEEVMTQASFDIAGLPLLKPIKNNYYSGKAIYQPYKPGKNLVPEFLAVSNKNHQVRITASTHNQDGIIQGTTAAGMDNTKRLESKIINNLDKFTFYEYNKQEGAEKLLIAYGITAAASREAIKTLRENGEKVSLLIPKTLLPVPPIYIEIIEKYQKVVIAEENLGGQYRKILFGVYGNNKVKGVNGIAKLITPSEIMEEISR